MNKPLCIKCEVSFKVERNGVLVVELFQKDTEIYKIWYADLYKCPGCGVTIVGAFAENPVMQNGDAREMAEFLRLKKLGGVPIYYWRERLKDGG